MANAVVPNTPLGHGYPQAARLGGFCRVATFDVDEAADQVGRIFCPHRLTPQRAPAADFHALHNCADFDGFSINFVSYGGSVLIDPGCLERFFLLQVPVSGSARIATAAHEIESRPGMTASLLSPTIPTQMVWQDGCAQLILLVERRLVEQRAAALAGGAVRAVEFEPAVDLTTRAAGVLQTQIAALVEFAECNEPRRRSPTVALADRREALLDALLTGLRHDRSDAIATFSGCGETLPRSLGRARDWLHANAAESLDLVRLAEAAGIGIRALQLGFQRHFGMSMSQMLLDIRLARLNAQLRSAPPDARIIEMAFDLGFTHLGRMSGAYRAKFGESPSATLRRLH